jgi:hypothetical protein
VTRRIRIPLAAFVGAALVAGACSSASGASETLVLGGVEFTEPEFLYGLDVDPDPSVEFAPDVVVVPNGSRAVRDVTGDGLTWTLDPRARGIGDLEVGMVMFLTARGVGRVVAIEDDPDSSNLLVTIAPVELTEVIWNGDFGGDDLPLDLEQMIHYSTGEQPWTISDLPPTEMPDEAPGEDEVDGTATAAAPTRAPRPGPRRSFIGGVPRVDPAPDAAPPGERIAPPRPDWGGATPTNVSGYTLTPICCHGGVGVHASYQQNGLTLSATMQFVGTMPKASWRLSIRNGRVQAATFRVTGGAGVRYDVRAGTTEGIPSNVHHRITLPGSLAFPAVAAGIPFMFTVRQELLVRTAFSAKTGTLRAGGTWSLSGQFGFGYENNHFGLVRPAAPEVRRSLLDSITGTSVGVSGLVLGHRVELKVGIGWETFNIGPYTELITSIGIVRGSDLGAPLLVCRQANLNMWMGAGIGYRLPQIVVTVVNFVLNAVGANPIATEGTITGTRLHLVQKHGFAPNSRACDNSAA